MEIRMEPYQCNGIDPRRKGSQTILDALFNSLKRNHNASVFVYKHDAAPCGHAVDVNLGGFLKEDPYVCCRERDPRGWSDNLGRQTCGTRIDSACASTSCKLQYWDWHGGISFFLLLQVQDLASWIFFYRGGERGNFLFCRVLIFFVTASGFILIFTTCSYIVSLKKCGRSTIEWRCNFIEKKSCVAYVCQTVSVNKESRSRRALPFLFLLGRFWN